MAAVLTIQEITELRRTGQLEKALKEAEILFAQFKNKYTAAALFWCLSETFKKEPAKDRILSLFKKMKSLSDSYCSEDKFIQNAFNKIELKINDPLFFDLHEAIISAKNGNKDIDFNGKIGTLWKDAQFPEYLHMEYAWLLYYILKHTPVYEVKERKILLNQYLNLNATKPSLLHSRILAEAIKTKQSYPNQFRMKDFLNLWGIENLTDKDWEQFKSNEGNTITSSVEKLIGLTAKELKRNKTKPTEAFSKLVDKALLKIKNNPNLPLYKAMLFVCQNKTKEALDYYRRLILKYPSRSYLWEQAADLIKDENIKIGLICRTILKEKNEEFLGKCRLKLARLLIRNGMKAEAKKELEISKEFYLSKGWYLKFDFKRVYQSLNSVVPSNDNKSLYEKYSAYSEEFMYSGLSSKLAVKVNEKEIECKNARGSKEILWTLRTKERTIFVKKPSQLKLGKDSDGKCMFNIIMADEKIVSIKGINTVPPDVDWIKIVEGEAKLRVNANGNPYCIIDGVYVGGKLLTNVKEKQKLSILAYNQNDRWSAISIRNI